MSTSRRFPSPSTSVPPYGPVSIPQSPAGGYHAGRAAFQRLLDARLPACVTDALATPADAGRLSVIEDPAAFDPLVYVAASARLGELVYVGRTYDIHARIARHKRAFRDAAAWTPDLWACVRVEAPSAAHVEEGLIRRFQQAGHAAHLNRRRAPYAGGQLVSRAQMEALRHHGLVR